MVLSPLALSLPQDTSCSPIMVQKLDVAPHAACTAQPTLRSSQLLVRDTPSAHALDQQCRRWLLQFPSRNLGSALQSHQGLRASQQVMCHQGFNIRFMSCRASSKETLRLAEQVRDKSNARASPCQQACAPSRRPPASG